jgi:hypothetical protein
MTPVISGNDQSLDVRGMGLVILFIKESNYPTFKESEKKYEQFT